MNLKQQLKQAPGARNMYGWLQARKQRAAQIKAFAPLNDVQYERGPQIWRALDCLLHDLSGADYSWACKIEQERQKLLAQDGPLVDHTLEHPGLYDDGVSLRDACLVSKGPESGAMLYFLTRELAPRTTIELGTNVGISSSYIAAGLASIGNSGRLITLDASPYRQRVACNLHSRVGLQNTEYVNGLFTDTLSKVLSDRAPVDLAFIDGHHQYQPTLDYFEEILPASSESAVFVFDDIRWSGGMKKAWTEIREDDRFELVVDLWSVGICARRRSASAPRCIVKSTTALQASN